MCHSFSRLFFTKQKGYYHELFLRYRMFLCPRIKRKATTRASKSTLERRKKKPKHSPTVVSEETRRVTTAPQQQKQQQEQQQQKKQEKQQQQRPCANFLLPTHPPISPDHSAESPPTPPDEDTLQMIDEVLQRHQARQNHHPFM